MKRHNFILKEYEKALWKREKNKSWSIIFVLFTINLISFYLLSFKRDQLEIARSKAVFSIEEDKVTMENENYVSVFELRERFEKYLGEEIKLKSFLFDEEKILIEALGKDEIHCIEHIKALEEGEDFYIVNLSNIEKTEEGYKVFFHIVTKESR